MTTTTTLSTSETSSTESSVDWASLLGTSRLEQAARGSGRRSFSDVPADEASQVVQDGLRDYADSACEVLDSGHAIVVEELLQDADIAGDGEDSFPAWSALAQLLHTLSPYLPDTVQELPVDPSAIVCARPVTEAARVGASFAAHLAKRFDVRTVGDLLVMILASDRHRAQLLKIPRVTNNTLQSVLEWAREQSGCTDEELRAACMPYKQAVQPVDGEQGSGGSSAGIETESPHKAAQPPSCASGEHKAEQKSGEPDILYRNGEDEVSVHEAGPAIAETVVDTEDPPGHAPDELLDLLNLLASATDWVCRSCGAQYQGQPQPEKESALLKIRCTQCESGFCAPLATVELARLRAQKSEEEQALRARIEELEAGLPARESEEGSPFSGGLVVLVDVVPWRYRGSMATLEAMLGTASPSEWSYREVIKQAKEAGQAVLVDSRSPFADGFIARAVQDAVVFLRGAR